MKLLLDTHTFLGALEASERLSAKARTAIQNGENLKIVSYASLWEITITAALSRLELQTPWEGTLRQIERTAPGTVLACSVAHLESLSQLPQHHRDPSDRMLVAQALADDLTLINKDEFLDAYGVRRLW